MNDIRSCDKVCYYNITRAQDGCITFIGYVEDSGQACLEVISPDVGSMVVGGVGSGVLLHRVNPARYPQEVIHLALMMGFSSRQTYVVRATFESVEVHNLLLVITVCCIWYVTSDIFLRILYGPLHGLCCFRDCSLWMAGLNSQIISPSTGGWP